MARISGAHRIRVALATCAVTAVALLSLGAPRADADVLGAGGGQVEEVAAQAGVPAVPVQAATEAVTAPVEKIVAGAAQPAQAPRAPSPPSAGKSGAPSPAAGKPGAQAGQATRAVSGIATAAGASTRSAGGLVGAAKSGVESATGTKLPAAPVATGAADDASREASAVAGLDESVGGTASSGASTADAGASAPADPAAATAAPTYLPGPPRNTYSPAPAQDGSVGAPLPRWVAYVWPAVALTGSYAERLGERWARSIDRLVAGGAGSHAEGGVLGVHASGGHVGAGDSTPLFARLPMEAGRAFSSVPTPVFVYLGALLLAVVGVGLGLRREVLRGRGS